MTGAEQEVRCDPLDAGAIRSALARPRAVRLEVRGEVDSTNALAADMLRAGATTGGGLLAVVAERQTAGRGRRGRRWLDGAGGSICLSVARAAAPGVAPAGLSLACGVAVAQTLRDSGAGGASLKWPNDIVAMPGGDGAPVKLGGILVEVSARPGGDYGLVIGVGLNLRAPAPAVAETSDRGGESTAPGADGPAAPAAPLQPAGLCDFGLRATTRNRLTAALIDALGDALECHAAAGFAPFHARWCALDAFADRPVRVSGEGPETVGVARGVDADGALLVETAAGTLRFVSADVSLRPL